MIECVNNYKTKKLAKFLTFSYTCKLMNLKMYKTVMLYRQMYPAEEGEDYKGFEEKGSSGNPSSTSS